MPEIRTKSEKEILAFVAQHLNQKDAAITINTFHRTDGYEAWARIDDQPDIPEWDLRKKNAVTSFNPFGRDPDEADQTVPGEETPDLAQQLISYGIRD
jgi:hypothetical protein